MKAPRYLGLQLILFVAFALLLFACGGGGGGGGGSGLEPTGVSIEANPSSIDSGDRIRVTVKLNPIHADGVLLKLRYTTRLFYVTGSGALGVNDGLAAVAPAFNESTGSGNAKTYLVFDLPHSLFGDEDHAQLEVLLQGNGKVNGGEIEVDSDLNDPSIPTDQKFSILHPEFDPLDGVQVDVNDESGSIQPTVTPTVTITPTATNTKTPKPGRTSG